jgi:hypothetical protein
LNRGLALESAPFWALLNVIGTPAITFRLEAETALPALSNK